eukprot:CAMPEP_0185735998 /NCGR_PEP_ID=MMETSP1171-20130828/26641_1 /TAXON_ID=374046 /ORGANISM="Helicotheca tamensis, Strain CCMP826" /LENGTH=465 /DNA_ID=CAMNT_0028406473 /DNA_START=167 /DNA_END=1564 /DNA_ORIENTATION=-
MAFLIVAMPFLSFISSDETPSITIREGYKSKHRPRRRLFQKYTINTEDEEEEIQQYPPLQRRTLAQFIALPEEEEEEEVKEDIERILPRKRQRRKRKKPQRPRPNNKRRPPKNRRRPPPPPKKAVKSSKSIGADIQETLANLLETLETMMEAEEESDGETGKAKNPILVIDEGGEASNVVSGVDEVNKGVAGGDAINNGGSGSVITNLGNEGTNPILVPNEGSDASNAASEVDKANTGMAGAGALNIWGSESVITNLGNEGEVSMGGNDGNIENEGLEDEISSLLQTGESNTPGVSSTETEKEVVPTPKNTNNGCVTPTTDDGLPCPNLSLAAACDKYNTATKEDGSLVANFRDCYQLCKPSFCCIHDSRSQEYSPSCREEPNCPLYFPCYIIWWKLHDTIGPANFLRVGQREPFYDTVDFNYILSDLNEDPAFFRQLFGHHFDTQFDDPNKSPKNEDFENSTLW